MKDTSGLGIIDEISDAHITKTESEFSAKGIVRAKTFPWLMLATLGTSSTPTLIETGVYSHVMTRKNDNAHPTHTIIHDNATQEEMALYCMLDKMKLTAEVGSQMKFDVSFKGRGVNNTT